MGGEASPDVVASTRRRVSHRSIDISKRNLSIFVNPMPTGAAMLRRNGRPGTQCAKAPAIACGLWASERMLPCGFAVRYCR
jgi:hypothetical protein